VRLLGAVDRIASPCQWLRACTGRAQALWKWNPTQCVRRARQLPSRWRFIAIFSVACKRFLDYPTSADGQLVNTGKVYYPPRIFFADCTAFACGSSYGAAAGYPVRCGGPGAVPIIKEKWEATGESGTVADRAERSNAMSNKCELSAWWGPEAACATAD